MGETTRSPLLGYNHNVRYGGCLLHVQTEDSGPANPHLSTHLFFEGSVLATKRRQYDAASAEQCVRELMQGQHKELLKELKRGLYDDRLGSFFSARGEVFTSPHQAAAEASPAPLRATDTEAPSTHADAPEPPVALPETTPSPSLEILDLDSIATPPPEMVQMPEKLPLHIPEPALPGPEPYAVEQTTHDTATVGPSEPSTPPDGRRSPKRQLFRGPVSSAAVQRRIVMGDDSKTPGVARPSALQPRRPRGGGPYVVREGSHAKLKDSNAKLTASRKPEQRVPPATPIGETAEYAAAPRTTAPPPVPEETPPESPVSKRSLDDVILAYLSKGDQHR